MKNVSEQISQLYLETFSLEKLKVDLFNYLNENINGLFAKNNLSYTLNTFFEDENNKYETVTISEDDEITLLHYQSFLDFGTDFQFKIIIGIGEFIKAKTPELSAFFKIEKCLAKLRYNADLTLYDVDFYITEMNKK